MGVSEDIQLDCATAASSPNPTANAASQRCRGMAEDADERMATLRATDALSD